MKELQDIMDESHRDACHRVLNTLIAKLQEASAVLASLSIPEVDERSELRHRVKSFRYV
jgi:hypothetical protein